MSEQASGAALLLIATSIILSSGSFICNSCIESGSSNYFVNALSLLAADFDKFVADSAGER